MKLLGCMFLGASLTLGTISCGSDNNSNEPDVPTPVDPGKKDDVSKDMTPEEQKHQLEVTGKKALGMINANDFRNLDQIAHHLDRNYMSESAWKDVNKWADDVLKTLTTTISTRSTIHKDYARLIDASKFTGHFNVQNGKWVRVSDADDLQFSFLDQNNSQCILTLATSGKTTRVRSEYFNQEDYDYDYNGDDYDKTITTYENTIVVPENVRLTLTQAGKQIISVDVHTSLTTKGELDFSADNVEVTCKTIVNNYEVNVKRAFYKGPGTAAADVEIKSGGKTLLTATATANGNISNERVNSIGTVNMAIDLLGELQIKGTCDDGSRFYDAIQAMDDDEKVYTNEPVFKKEVDKANDRLNLGVFYNGSDKRSANLLLGAFEDGDYYGSGAKYWSYQPVIKFSDGSSYGFDQYFTKQAFRSIFDEATDLIDSFKRMFSF